MWNLPPLFTDIAGNIPVLKRGEVQPLSLSGINFQSRKMLILIIWASFLVLVAFMKEIFSKLLLQHAFSLTPENELIFVIDFVACVPSKFRCYF